MDQVMHWFMSLPAWGQVIMAIVALVAGLNIAGFVIGAVITVVVWAGMILAGIVAFVVGFFK